MKRDPLTSGRRDGSPTLLLVDPGEGSVTSIFRLAGPQGVLSVVSVPLLDDWPFLSKGSRAASNTLLQTNSFARPATGIPRREGCQDASSNNEGFSKRLDGSVTEVEGEV